MEIESDIEFIEHKTKIITKKHSLVGTKNSMQLWINDSSEPGNLMFKIISHLLLLAKYNWRKSFVKKHLKITMRNRKNNITKCFSAYLLEYIKIVLSS